MFRKSAAAEPVIIEPAAIEPPSSASLWGDMFGIGGLLKMFSDPKLAEHAVGMMQAIIESAKANARIERKLDVILEQHGYDPERLPPRDPAAAAPADRRGIRTGGHTAAGAAADNGAGAAMADSGLAVGAIIPGRE